MTFLLLGDSQVSRVWRDVSNDRELLRAGIFTSVYNETQRVEAIRNLSAQVRTIVITCLTNIFIDTLPEDPDSRPALLNQLIETLFRGEAGLTRLCEMLPDLNIFVSPPNIRNFPSWYPPYRRQIVLAIETEVSKGPPNLHLLDDFHGDIEPDGVHFTLVSGMHFVKNLADQVAGVLARPKANQKRSVPEISQSVTSSLVNGIEQRVSVLESKLDNLDARQSEEIDNNSNERDLHRFIISGLKRLTKPTQEEVRSQVFEFVRQLVPTFKADEIKWVRVLRSTSTASYNVETVSVASATAVKSAFASAVKTSKPPEFIGRVSISYCHSLGTRVRLSLLRSISRHQREKSRTAICHVTSFTARPLLRVGETNKGSRFLTFVDAMQGYRHLLTQADLDRAASLCKSLKGCLRSRFIVLSDDRELPPPPKGSKRPADDDSSERMDTAPPPKK